MNLISAILGKPKADELPLLPLRELVLFPHTMVPVFVTAKAGLAAVEEASKGDKRLVAACRRPDSKDDETYATGTIARVVQQLKMPDGTMRIILEGESRARFAAPVERDGASFVRPEAFPCDVTAAAPGGEDAEEAALVRAIRKAFASYAELSKKVNPDAAAAVERADDPDKVMDLACHSMALKIDKKAELLSVPARRDRLEAVYRALEFENEILGLQRKISGKVKSRMDKNQREYILNEQLKEINRELGRDSPDDEFKEIEKAIEAKSPPAEVLAKARKELSRMRKLQPLSPEAGVLRAYLEWIADLPWSESTEDLRDLRAAERVLDEDHFDMRKAKERIVEFIAVRQLTDVVKGPILCFVGPPGTGKTSLGRSVARALGRRFVRVSLGGVRDEAEIRGHRKTYVGALPGKIVQSMKKAGSSNPVFLLDEIDKLSNDFRGDPASALLEVLDPEQNSAFVDHYLEVPYDLSKVLFIATANSLHTIPYPLLDRMEVIEVPGYGELEKLRIAKDFLVPKELAENGLGDSRVSFKDDAILDVVRYWTMESGVRGLEREIARCVRRVAREAVLKGYGTEEKPIARFRRAIGPRDLDKLLGRRTRRADVVYEPRVGVVHGLAWTETGGTLLPVEAARFEGSGELILTGNLGDVMKESARAALSYLRGAAERYAFEGADVGKADFHVHVPEGAIPKDGPSAGVALAAALASTLSGVPPRPLVAMTGELTLTGRVLAIGGVKEKALAAVRNGMAEIVLPKANREEFEELGADVAGAVKARFVETVDEAFSAIFGEAVYAAGGSPDGVPAPISRSSPEEP